MRLTAEDRFNAKVKKDAESGCWLWKGTTTPTGYSRFYAGRIDGRDRWTSGHRWAYEHYTGAIPDGLHLDHLCRNRACVNPEHLEPVTVHENNARSIPPLDRGRRTHCIRGHLLEGENVYVRPNGKRQCRACATLRATEWSKTDRGRESMRIRAARYRDRRS